MLLPRPLLALLTLSPGSQRHPSLHPCQTKRNAYCRHQGFLKAITIYNLIGEFSSPTLVQDLQDLASLHNTSISPTIQLTAPVIGTETRVGSHDESSVQEKRVVILPTLAAANPMHTTPSAQTPIVALLPSPYPPPGLPPLPDTDRPNVLLDSAVAVPTVPVAPPRRTS